MKKWLFNPFVYIAGTKSLLAGLVFMAGTGVIGYYSRTHFDGVLDMHIGRISTLPAHLWEQLVDWGIAVLCFFTAGKIFSGSSIRFIDVAGTMAMARWVMVFSAIAGFGVDAPATMPHEINEVSRMITPSFILLSLLCLVFTIWMVALMYNAFRVSCNIKGGRATSVFIVTLIVAEALSKIAIHFLHKQF